MTLPGFVKPIEGPEYVLTKKQMDRVWRESAFLKREEEKKHKLPSR